MLGLGESATIRRPTLVGAVLGKMAAVAKIVSQPREQRAKHLGDVDSLARLVGGADRLDADLTKQERSALMAFADNEKMSELARRSLLLLAGVGPCDDGRHVGAINGDGSRRAVRRPLPPCPIRLPLLLQQSAEQGKRGVGTVPAKTSTRVRFPASPPATP